MRVATSLASAVDQYPLLLSSQVTVGEIARYLSQQEAYIDVSTLERARPLDPNQALQDVQIQTGDRLVIFTQKPESAQLPEALGPGDKLLKFSRGDYEITSRSKKQLLIGRHHAASGINPDVDLRNFVSPRDVEAISRKAVMVEFDNAAKVWYASRVGQTPVFVDDLQLENRKVALNNNSRLRFFQGNRLIGEIRVRVEDIQASGEDLAYLQPGEHKLALLVGSERETQIVNAADALPAGKLAEYVLSYNKTQTESQLYLMRLIAPTIRLDRLSLGQGGFLYAARQFRYAQNLLILRDVHDTSREFEIPAGLDEEERRVGRRSQADQPDPELDVDLYEALISREGNPEAYRNISRRQARVFFKDNNWAVRLEEGARAPVFVNNLRLTA
ncbi:MAG: EsaB/YukD family protein, partial [Anaerolineae bacterium]|nr:EsaB/YukD family protein [Anaerolineae bacterium]